MRRSGGTWATVGVAGLAIVAVGMAFAAMDSTRSSPAPTPTASALSSPNEEKKPDNVGEPGVRPSVDDALPEILEPPFLMVDADVAFRGRTGTCLGGASLERTTNGGKRWGTVDVPAEAILDLRATGVGSIEVVGADERCRVQVWTSADRGQTWAAPRRASGIFVRLPETPRDIQTPSGIAKNPCPDRDISPLAIEEISATEAAVLCAGGDVLATADGGLTWGARTTVVGAQAMAFEGPLLGWVLVRDGGRCPAYEAQITQDGGVSWNLGGCLGDEPIVDDRVLPALSFATPTDGLADLAGRSWLTPDGGQRWQLPT